MHRSANRNSVEIRLDQFLSEGSGEGCRYFDRGTDNSHRSFDSELLVKRGERKRRRSRTAARVEHYDWTTLIFRAVEKIRRDEFSSVDLELIARAIKQSCAVTVT